MANPPVSPNLAKALAKVIGYVEKIALALSLMGILFKYLQFSGSNELLIIGLFTLSTTLFLSGFVSAQPPGNSFVLIALKLGYIGSSTGVVGILFTLLHFEGAREILTVSTLTLAGVVLLSGAQMARQDSNLNFLKPMLIRATPIFLSCAYLFYQLSNTNT